MDLAVMPETLEGYRCFLVYQNYYSKFTELLPMAEKTHKAVAELLIREIFSCSEIVTTFHSHQGNEINSAIIHELGQLWRLMKTRVHIQHGSMK